MWAQKKKHSNFGGGDGDNSGAPFALKAPKFKGVGDIEALLAQSDQNDIREKQEQERNERERGFRETPDVPKNRSFCGC